MQRYWFMALMSSARQTAKRGEVWCSVGANNMYIDADYSVLQSRASLLHF